MTDQEFDRLCEANSFGSVARNEFPLVPRAMLKALVDAAMSTEILKQQDRITRLEDWKQSALEVEREWDANAIATMLGAKLGESQRKVIQRKVPLLLERIKRLEDAGDEMEKYIHDQTNTRFIICAIRWREAKEDKL